VPTLIDADLHEYNNWNFRFRPATTFPSRLLIMLHGWTGDENSMWVFAHSLPTHFEVLSPRGPFSSRDGGYSWCEERPGASMLPELDDFRNPAEALFDFVDDWYKSKTARANQFDLIGFSQGAALSYVVTILYPERIHALAALSGFVPKGCEKLFTKDLLLGKSVYISHGRQDKMVPVEEARKAAVLMENTGAKVTYCESDGGHKVGAECFSGITNLFD
jgi:phospholipase/carboxylesterase